MNKLEFINTHNTMISYSYLENIASHIKHTHQDKQIFSYGIINLQVKLERTMSAKYSQWSTASQKLYSSHSTHNS